MVWYVNPVDLNQNEPILMIGSVHQSNRTIGSDIGFKNFNKIISNLIDRWLKKINILLLYYYNNIIFIKKNNILFLKSTGYILNLF